MKAGVLFSGGKDSCLALHKFGIDNVSCLLAMLPKTRDSFMFHMPNLKLLTRQAEMLSLPLVIQETRGEKEEELYDLKKLIKKSQVDIVVIGGIKSEYQGDRIGKVCDDLGVKVIAPLWDYSADKLWSELLDFGFKVILTKISCEGLGKEWIGGAINKNNFLELKRLAEKYKFRLDFEGGDAETSVLWMPEFGKEIKVDFDVVSEGKYRHFIKIKNIS